MALSNAERQRLYRERHKVSIPLTRNVTAVRKDRRSRVQRWQDAIETLRDLQGQYQEWLDNLPESLQDSTLAEKLQAVCELDIDELDVDLPRGFGRD